MGSKFMNKLYQGSDSIQGDKNRLVDLVIAQLLANVYLNPSLTV